MKSKIKLAIFFLTMSFFCYLIPTQAGDYKKLTLEELDLLVAISQDLPAATPVLIATSSKKERHCLCACRDSEWSCTNVDCHKHGEECEAD